MNETTTLSEFNWTFNSTPEVTNVGFINPFDKLHIRLTFCILYTLAFICCFFGNLLVLFVIIRNARMRTRTNFFLANLAAADFCVGVFCIYPNLSTYLSPVWHLGRVMCKVYYFAHHMSLTFPVMLLSVISIERYVAILYPLKAKQLFTIRRLRITQVLIWILLAIYNSPQLIVHDTFTFGKNTFCYFRSDTINNNVYVLVNLIVWYILPLFILSFMYCKIAATLWQSSSSNNFAINPQQNKHQSQTKKSSYFNQNKFYSNPLRRVKFNSNKRTTSDEENRQQVECLDMSIIESSTNTENSDRLCHCGSIRSQPETQLEYISEGTSGEIESTNSSYKTKCTTNYTPEKVISRTSEDNEEISKNSKHRSWPLKRKKKEEQAKSNIVCRSNNARFVSTGFVKNSAEKRPCVTNHKTVMARKKIIRLLLMIIGSFAVLTLPYHVRTCLYMWSDARGLSRLFSPICFLLYYANSGLNPLLYAFLSENFRKSLKESFKCFF